MTITNKVSWAIEPERCALLIHDMQPHYLAPLPSDLRERLIANVRTIASTCFDGNVPVFASLVPPVREGRERGLMRDMWGGGPPSSDTDLDARLGLGNRRVRLLTKRSYSAFYGNDFEVQLRRLGRDAVLIAGVYTSIGCHYSAVNAFMRDIRAFLVSDATADMSVEAHQTGLSSAARLCARIIDTQEVCGAVARPSVRRMRLSERIDVC